MKKENGFTLMELLIVVTIIGILAAVAIPSIVAYNKKAQAAAALAESRELYRAFIAFYMENNKYPNASNSPAFDLATCSPLDYDGELMERMVGSKADKFDSPDDQGSNQEFWLRMTLAKDPTVQFVIARSDNVDLEPGVRLDGVFLYRNGVRAVQ